jgi:hypothetical protein
VMARQGRGGRVVTEQPREALEGDRCVDWGERLMGLHTLTHALHTCMFSCQLHLSKAAVEKKYFLNMSTEIT